MAATLNLGPKKKEYAAAAKLRTTIGILLERVQRVFPLLHLKKFLEGDIRSVGDVVQAEVGSPDIQACWPAEPIQVDVRQGIVLKDIAALGQRVSGELGDP